MISEPFKKTFIFLMLGLLTVSAFFIRVENFKNTRLRTIDEIGYYRMARQILDEGPSGYHMISYGKELVSKGRPMPKYFFQPLFKHPPVFTFLATLSMKIFGPKLVSAGYVSLLLGTLMIPLIYLLGVQIFNRRVGILSALFLWLDPVSIICSQKVWMDSTIAFFTLLAALSFIYGLKHENNWMYILSGFSSGLAVNTKYTGIFITLIIALYCLLYHKEIFKNKIFQLSLILPFFMLIPWLCWNYKIYGVASVLSHSELNSTYTRAIQYIPAIIFFVILAVLLFLLSKRIDLNFSYGGKSVDSTQAQGLAPYISVLLPTAFFIFIIPTQFFHSLQWAYIPTHTWYHGLFSAEPPSFYFGRLLEYSFIYALSFFSIFLYHPNEKNEAPFIRLCAMVILLFFIFWGNFQSRYILSSLPFLIIIGVHFGINVHEKASVSKNVLYYWGGQLGIKLIFIFIILKSYYLNLVMSYPNDMCYF